MDQQAANDLGFEGVEAFLEVYRGASFAVRDVTPAYLPDGSCRVKFFTHEFEIGPDVFMSEKVLDLLVFEMFVSGCRHPEFCKFVKFSFHYVRPRQLPELLEKMVVAKLMLHGHKPRSISNFPWYHYGVDKDGVVTIGDQLLHPAFYEMGLVKNRSVTIDKYLQALDDMGVRFGGVTEKQLKENLDAKQSLVAALSAMLGWPMVMNDEHKWTAATHAHSLLSSDQIKLRKKMAIAGDHLLKASVAALYVNSTLSAQDLSDVLSGEHSNPRMSMVFSVSPLAKIVMVGGEVRLESGKVGADFLEAIAYLVYEQLGAAGVLKFAQVMNLSKFMALKDQINFLARSMNQMEI